MSKFKVKLAALVVVLSGAAAMNAAQAVEPGLYLGIDGGKAQARKFCDNITNCSNSDTSVRGEVGYQFNKSLAVELGYTSFGTLFSANNSGANASEKANAWTGSLLAGLPIGKVFSIYGRVGAARYQVDSSGTVAGVPVAKNNSTKPYYGAGVEFDLTRNFMLRGEYQLYKDISGVSGAKDDIQAWFAGVGFRF